MGVTHQSGAARERGTVNPGDQRFSQPRANCEELLVDGVHFLVGHPGYFRKVHPWRRTPYPNPAGAGRYRAHTRIAAGIIEGSQQGAAEIGIQGIALVRAVEGESQQASLASGIQYIGHRVWGRRKDRLPARSTRRFDYSPAAHRMGGAGAGRKFFLRLLFVFWYSFLHEPKTSLRFRQSTGRQQGLLRSLNQGFG